LKLAQTDILKKSATIIVLSVLLIGISLSCVFAQNEGILTDMDSNIYKIVKIGNQTWMAENLRSTRLNDGTAINLVSNNTEWAAISAPAYCWYKNDTIHKNVYGALYNAYTILTYKLCPAGWHVSTNSDWAELETYLGGEGVAGGKLKESGTLHWTDPNSGATNETLFTALPGGSRYTNGLFLTIKNIGYWWSPGESNTFNNWYRSMYYRNNAVSRNFIDSTNGFSVRCVRD
jgi:uncharacterized protein (TIGR02145 family)